jgi:hypothetical protein
MRPLEWEGHPLDGTRLAMALSTERGSSDFNQPPLILAAVNDGERSYMLRPEQINEFLRVHPKALLICHDVGFFFWTIHDHFYRAADWTAWQAIWDHARRGRLHDVKLLDQLIHLAEEGGHPTPKRLDELAPLYGGRQPDDGHRMRDHRAVDWGGRKAVPDDQSWDRVAREADLVMRIYSRQRQLADGIAERLGVGHDSIARFGPLAVDLQVQGVIALECAARNGLHLSEAETSRLRLLCDQVYRECSQQLAHHKSSKHCFSWDGDRVRLDLSGLPAIDKSNLRGWLEKTIKTIPGALGIPFEPPRTPAGRISTLPDTWEDLALIRPEIRAWSRLWTAASALKALDGMGRVGDGRLRPRYEVVPRIRSLDPNLERLRRLDPSLEFKAAPGHSLLVGRLPDLVLRCYAEIGERRNEPTLLKSLFQDEIEPHRFVAYSLHDLEMGRPQGAEMEEWKEFDAIDREDPGRFARWKQLARALLRCAALGVGLSNVRAFLQADSTIDFKPGKIENNYPYLIFELVRDFYFSMQDESLELLAGKLGCSSFDLPVLLLVPEHPGTTAAALRNLIAGKTKDSSTFDDLRQICRDESWREKLAAGAGSPGLYRELFSSVVVGPVGRGRKGLFFTRLSAAAHLDLADDVMKTVVFRVVSEGHTLITCLGDEFVVEVRAESDPEKACRSIESAANDAARSILEFFPPRCEVRAQSSW